MKIYDKIIAKEEKIAVVGLGYVGLPIALEFAKITNVIGFDINPPGRILEIKQLSYLLYLLFL